MIYVNLDQPYEDAVHALKRHYAIKTNQAMIEHLVRQDALRLGLWPQHPPAQPTDKPDGEAPVTLREPK